VATAAAATAAAATEVVVTEVVVTEVVVKEVAVRAAAARAAAARAEAAKVGSPPPAADGPRQPTFGAPSPALLRAAESHLSLLLAQLRKSSTTPRSVRQEGQVIRESSRAREGGSSQWLEHQEFRSSPRSASGDCHIVVWVRAIHHHGLFGKG
jgi:hypothetical protein